MNNKKAQILLVEDDLDLVDALKLRLEANNYAVIIAKNGMEGLDLARSQNPDLIILDIMLPKMDGFKMARMLKFDERYKKIPIIVLSAKVQKEDIEQGKEVGADYYITKPFKTEELMQKIQEFMAKPA